MTRKPRVHFPGAFYHMTAQGSCKSCSFVTHNYNIKYKEWAHLFQGRYKGILCDKDSYFLELSTSIHLNPVGAGLAKRPHQYPWSNYRFYVRERKDTLVDRDFLLTQFSTKRSEPGEHMAVLSEAAFLTAIERTSMS